MPTITLESLKATVKSKYEPVTIDMGEDGSFDLVMSLRLSDEDFKAMAKKQHEFSAMQEPEIPRDEDGNELPLSEEDEEEMFNLRPKLCAKMREMVMIPATNKELCAKYLDQVGDDLPMLMELLSIYNDSTQLGEASASQSS